MQWLGTAVQTHTAASWVRALLIILQDRNINQMRCDRMHVQSQDSRARVPLARDKQQSASIPIHVQAGSAHCLPGPS